MTVMKIHLKAIAATPGTVSETYQAGEALPELLQDCQGPSGFLGGFGPGLLLSSFLQRIIQLATRESVSADA